MENQLNSTYKLTLESFLKGFGQIMLQESAVTGFFFLAGIFYGSITMGLAAVLAVFMGITTAKILKFKPEEINAGLYGFSPALVGVALILFFKPTFLIWGLIVVGAILSAIIQHYFVRKKIPVFTLPFVLVTWFFLVLPYLGISLPKAEDATQVLATTMDFGYTFRGYGQVIFQGSLISGILFFIGVFIHSPVAALYGLAASAAAGMLVLWFGMPPEDISFGLFGFNAVLCAITFAGVKQEDGLWVLLAVGLSLVLSFWMIHVQWPQLTFPFVAASMITVGIKNLFSVSADTK